MATIVIKDLPDNIELDREAMTAITGGSRTRGRPGLSGQTILRSTRIVSYPPGLARKALTAKKAPAK